MTRVADKADAPSESGRGTVADPAGYYTDPTAIQADKTLSKQQKQRYLADLQADLGAAREPEPALQADVAAVRREVERQPQGAAAPAPEKRARGG